VLFDALSAARARQVHTLIVDTAGRLHTKKNLMEELAKMRRIAAREVDGAPHRTLLVLDATTGVNGLTQARRFVEAAGADGVVLTKLDGSARGGIVLAIYRELQLPVSTWAWARRGGPVPFGLGVRSCAARNDTH
jgi:fused signal recognition particle receptor